MVQINVIALAPLAAVAGCNAVFEAMGRGPDSLSRKATSAENVTWEASATHKYMSDQGVTEEFQAQLLKMVGGDLPPLADGRVWGVDGVISAEDAMAATAQLIVVSFGGDMTAEKQVAAALAAQSPPLQVVPFPPL